MFTGFVHAKAWKLECINTLTKINSTVTRCYSYIVIQRKMKQTRTLNTNTLTLTELPARTRPTPPPPPTHTHRWIVHTWITSADSPHPHPSPPPQNKNNGQPAAGVSFSVNRLNDPKILVSLWSSKLIEPDQIFVHMKSVSAHSPLRPLWRSCRPW